MFYLFTAYNKESSLAWSDFSNRDLALNFLSTLNKGLECNLYYLEELSTYSGPLEPWSLDDA